MALALSVALSGLFWVLSAAAAPSPVVFPAQRLPLVFSHALHVGKVGAACVDCHAAASTSRSAVDRLTPGEDACRKCHAIDRTKPEGTGTGAAPSADPPTACAACHPGYTPGDAVARIFIPTPHLKFSHAAHATTACETCHAGVATATLATRDHLPKMELCLTCHDGARAANECTTCHLATQGGRMRTALPDGHLAPVGGVTGAMHDADFRTNHDELARAESRSCESCHEKRFCADCHAGSTKPMDFHPGDYVTLHAVEARRNVPDCGVCHKSQRFCVGCHERSGVGVRAESGFDRTGVVGRFHRPSWDHGVDAQKNVKACAACHREDFCVECHSAEPMRLGPSPHGPGWRGSARCRALASKNQRMCLRCHIEIDRVGCD